MYVASPGPCLRLLNISYLCHLFATSVFRGIDIAHYLNLVVMGRHLINPFSLASIILFKVKLGEEFQISRAMYTLNGVSGLWTASVIRLRPIRLPGRRLGRSTLYLYQALGRTPAVSLQ